MTKRLHVEVFADVFNRSFEASKKIIKRHAIARIKEQPFFGHVDEPLTTVKWNRWREYNVDAADQNAISTARVIND